MDGMDISSYVTNPEWDLIGTSGTRNEVIYDCCPEPYLDITYNIHVRIRTIPYLPSFTITLVSILTLLIPGYPFKKLLWRNGKVKGGVRRASEI